MLFVGYRWTDSRNSPLVGPVWESYIYAEFRKLAAARRYPETLWYYRDDQGRELDFIRMHQGQLDLFEVKWSEAPIRNGLIDC